MSRISKDLAGQIARKLTEKSRIATEKYLKEYQKLVTDLYEEQIPQAVKDCFKKYPDWFYTRLHVTFAGHGFSHESITPTKNLICNEGTSSTLILTAKIADQLTSAKRKWLKAKDNYDQLRLESEQALLTLKTFNNIRKELPEAAPMLPPPMSNALVVNFDSLKNRLKRQPDEIKQPVK